MICQAKGCFSTAMIKEKFCGACDEANEEYPLLLKPGLKSRGAEVIAKANATRAANQEAKSIRYAILREARIERDAAREVLAEVKAKREARAR